MWCSSRTLLVFFQLHLSVYEKGRDMVTLSCLYDKRFKKKVCMCDGELHPAVFS